jgi:hypothetical protein
MRTAAGTAGSERGVPVRGLSDEATACIGFSSFFFERMAQHSTSVCRVHRALALLALLALVVCAQGVYLIHCDALL